MNDFTDTPQSTVIEAAEPAPAPQADLSSQEPPKPEAKEEPKLTRREQIEKSLDKIEEDDKAERKAARDAKAEAAEQKAKDNPAPKDDKAAKDGAPVELKEPVADGAERKPHQQGAQEAPASSEGEDDRSAPPARMTEDAKRVWGNVPRAVKAEWQRMDAELTRVSNESSEARAFHAELKDYDDLAKQYGTTIKEALKKYTDFEKGVAKDIGQGFAFIAQSQGKQPMETVGALLRAYGMTPQQYAQSVAQNPQAHQIAPQAPRDPMVAQVAAQVQQMQRMMQSQQQQQAMNGVQAEVDRWAQGRADYGGLQPAIAEILKSGIIERIHGQGLSVVQRLDAAYRMAGGNAQPIVPQSQNPASPPAMGTPSHAAGDAQSKPDAGNLSITGAPSGGKEPTIPRKPKSRRESIEAAMAQLSAQ